ncbi:MAG: PAS domain-containing protein [Deltaproteobacteria bacterium]|nr:PAS domain-containing protein [Deltaproteobacteria bacterium]
MKAGNRLSIGKKAGTVEKSRTFDDLTAVLEGLADGIIVTDREGRVMKTNGRALSYLDRSVDQVKGRSVAEVLSGIDDDWERDAPFWNHVPEAADGILRIKGRVILLLSSSLHGENGEAAGMVYTLRDESQLFNTKAGPGGDTFILTNEAAVNIAHEIRNPLGSIELYASLLMKDLKGAKARARAQQIIASVKSVDNKISNFLIFAKRERPVSERINLHDILREILMFSEQIVDQETVILTVRYAEGEPNILGDAGMLKQVFLNLILHALQSMPDGGCLAIETRPGERHTKEGRAESTIEVRFLDNGVGIPGDSLSKIFDPFFSTKEKNSGLGLAIVRHVVGMHRGSIHVESLQGGGTAFSLAFPLVENQGSDKAL